MRIKRLLSVLLAALLLPLGMLAGANGASADAEKDIWVQITEYEDACLSEQGVSAETATASQYGVMADGIAAIVEAHGSYAQGTLFRSGESVFWDDVNGMGCGWVPNARQKLRAHPTGADPMEVASVETVSYASKGGSPYSTDVALFGPYYGVDSSFSDQYRNEANSIAQATAGVCRVYSGGAATIDAVARELGLAGTVIFDSHGNTDYSSGSDYTSRANTSYLCLTSASGVTSADTATVQGPYGSYKHAFLTGSGAFVDGTAIANHMDGTAPNSFLWMAICLGMATDGMEAPLREAGVEVVYGYSQSVTFAGDYRWEAYFWDKMKNGADVAEAIAYMKQKGGYKDQYENRYPAFPIVVSSEDEYPGQGNVDAKQTVYSSWTLFSQYKISAESSDPNLGTVSVSGNTITATPKTGCAVTGFDVIEGAAVVTQSGDGLSETLFSVRAESDCVVRVNFARRTAASFSFITPAGVSCEPVSGYVGDQLALPSPAGKPSADGHVYTFYGWVDARVEDTETRPDFYRAGTRVTLTGDRTFYALYSYAKPNGSAVPEGAFLPLIGEPAEWTGEVVLTYDAATVLSANASAAAVSTAAAAVDAAEAGITVEGDLFTGVPEAYRYEIASVGGYYTIRMMGKDTPTYLCYNASGDRLSATTKIIVSSGRSNAYWTLSWVEGCPVFTNAQTVSATIAFDTAKGAFTCKKDNAGSPLTLYAATDCTMIYTTELKNASEIEPEPEPVEIEATVEWNGEDVGFKGTTPYVIADGTAKTPRFTVKNSADGSVVDPENYDYEYAENVAAGTGYVLVTFKGDFVGTARGSFKIYLPATEATTVENAQDGIRLSWDPVDGADGYVIYRRAWSSTTDGWTDFVRWNNTTELTWTDTKVFAGTRYQYGIKAYFARRLDPIANVEIGGNVGDNYNLGEVGPLKTTVRITTRTLNSLTPGAKQLTVKWSASSVFTGYQVQYATDAAFTKNAKAVKIADPKAAQTVLSGLSAGTTYYVRVRSYHEFNGMTYFGEWSNVLSAKTN